MKYGRIIQYAAIKRMNIKDNNYSKILDFLESKKVMVPGVKTTQRLAGMILHVINNNFIPEFDFRDYSVLITVNGAKGNPDLLEFVRKYQGIDVEGVFLK